MDTLTGIKVFRQVVESGSFVAAAERLDLSTAMVSKHVMHVERRRGDSECDSLVATAAC
jgi:DNA-binding transcriptional LysR family regulator